MPDIAELLLVLLPVNDIVRLSATCSAAHALCKRESLWKMLLCRDFGSMLLLLLLKLHAMLIMIMIIICVIAEDKLSAETQQPLYHSSHCTYRMLYQQLYKQHKPAAVQHRFIVINQCRRHRRLPNWRPLPFLPPTTPDPELPWNPMPFLPEPDGPAAPYNPFIHPDGVNPFDHIMHDPDPCMFMCAVVVVVLFYNIISNVSVNPLVPGGVRMPNIFPHRGGGRGGRFGPRRV